MANTFVMQPRCVHCLREQYSMAVYVVSLGEAGCTWCGHVPPVFTTQQAYRAALRKAREEAGDG